MDRKEEGQQPIEQDFLEQPEDFTLRDLRPQVERDDKALQMEAILEKLDVLEERVTALEGGDTVTTVAVMTPDTSR